MCNWRVGGGGVETGECVTVGGLGWLNQVNV